MSRPSFWMGIKSKVILMILLSLFALIGLTLLLNFFLLGKYYERSRQYNMKEVYHLLSDKSVSGVLYSAPYRLSFEQICTSNNMAVTVLDQQGGVKLTSLKEKEELTFYLLESLYGSRSHERIKQETEKTDHYQLSKVTDPRYHNQYLLLAGILDDGNMVVMRSDMESIEEATHISNRFLLYAGLFDLILALTVGYLIARMLTDPIHRLQRLAHQISELDFKAKYVSKGRHDEMDDLGESLNELSDKLEDAIGELRSANNELEQALEDKEEQELMRREFISNASHELKTPIAVIQGYAEGLMEGVAQTPEDVRFYTETILDESSRMSELVHQMLDLNELEYKGPLVSWENFDIMERVRSMVASQKVLAEEITIEVKPKTDPVWVYADPFLAEQVISNYLSNAIHYCQGEKRIDVHVEQLEGKVRLSVFNTGDPIPEAAIKHLFDKFYKVDKARSRAYGGSGIGLSVVKAIAESLDEDFGMKNHENGVEFYFTFALDQGREEKGNDSN